MTQPRELDTATALARALTRAEAAAATAEADANTSRHVLAVALFHVTGGKSREWKISAGKVAEAGAAVAALEWDTDPATGDLVVKLVTHNRDNGAT